MSAKAKAPLRIVSDRKPRGISPLVIAEQQANLKKIQMEKLEERKKARKRKITEQGDISSTVGDLAVDNSPTSPMTPNSPAAPFSPDPEDCTPDQEPREKKKCKLEPRTFQDLIKTEAFEHVDTPDMTSNIVKAEEKFLVKDEPQDMQIYHENLPVGGFDDFKEEKVSFETAPGEDCKSSGLIENVDVEFDNFGKVKAIGKDASIPQEKEEEKVVVEKKKNIDLEIVIAKDIDLAHIDKDNMDIEALNADRLPVDNDSTVIEEIADMLDMTKDEEDKEEDEEQEGEDGSNLIGVQEVEEKLCTEVFTAQEVMLQEDSEMISTHSMDFIQGDNIAASSSANDSSSQNLSDLQGIDTISGHRIANPM